mgnify:FL=1
MLITLTARIGCVRAVAIESHGGPEKLKAMVLPDPEVPEGYALIRVAATSLNRVDVAVRSGNIDFKVRMPHVPGVDVVGYVEKVNGNVANVSVGDLVVANSVYGCGKCRYCLMGMEDYCPLWVMIGVHVWGSYGEYVSVPARILVKPPGNLNIVELAAMPLTYSVAWKALRMGNVARDSTVLIWGGSGGVGTALVQLAKARGARVVATSASDWKLDKLREIGADLAVNHYDPDSVDEIIEYIGGDGVDVVFDLIGSTLQKSLNLVKPGGKVIVVGSVGGSYTSVNIKSIYYKHVTIMGIHNASTADLRDVLTFASANGIKPVIQDVIDIRDAADAHRAMERGLIFGKIVMRHEWYGD